MQWTTALLVIALALAGCSSDGPRADEEDPFEDLPDQPVSKDKGIIRGVVVDAAIVPVADAKVKLVGTTKETTSNPQGAFLFSDLDPGTYFLQVSKVGYASIQQGVDVVAGVEKPAVVKVLLERRPGTEPRAETQGQDGMIVCSIGQPTNDHSCDTTGTQRTDIVFDFDGRPDYVQTEIYWESTQPAGDNLYVIQGVCECDGLPSFAQRFDETSTATSLHVARAGPDFLREVGAGNTTFQVYVDVSSSGPALGTGIALDQAFTVYTTFFYNIEPEEEWTFFTDGHYQVPS